MKRKLNAVQTGDTVLVTGIGAEDKARTRLESLGVIPGAELDVLSNNSGSIIMSVGEGRIVLERGIAEMVFVA